MNKFKTPCLMLVTDPSPNLAWVVSEALTGGVTMIQWRQKAKLGKNFGRQYSSLCAVIQDAVPLVVNTDWDTSVILKAGNVHLPEKSVDVSVARKAVGPKGLVGKSVHSVESALEAEADGVDYLIAGTIFATTSHPDVLPDGVGLLAQICAAVKVPVLAIGGVTIENLGSCIDAGASGVAIMSPIMVSKAPCSISRLYRDALELSWSNRA